MRIQYCNGDTDITSQPLYAELDATLVRIWDEDEPVAELLPDGPEWRCVWVHGPYFDEFLDQFYVCPDELLEKLEEWNEHLAE